MHRPTLLQPPHELTKYIRDLCLTRWVKWRLFCLLIIKTTELFFAYFAIFVGINEPYESD